MAFQLCSWRKAVIILFLILFTIYFVNYWNNVDDTKEKLEKQIYQSPYEDLLYSTPHANNNITKYILIWTSKTTVPFMYLLEEDKVFKERKCEFSNCYITNDRSKLTDIKMWDAIIFHAPEFTHLQSLSPHNMPKERSPHQKYVFTIIESAQNYPVCDNTFNNFFNWTWTYRTDSEVKWGYVDIKDKEGNIVGPKENMQWIQPMQDVSTEMKASLRSKKKVAAWFSSNCFTSTRREEYVKKLQASLAVYSLSVDVFGKCGTLKCPPDNMKACHDMLRRDYFFYLSFENSFAEDYVTEKFLHAFSNNVVPVVLGGADYTRFAPPGSYINAGTMKADALAKMMVRLMNNTDEYASYFRWTNHYRYQRDIATPDTEASCRMCKALNNATMMEKRSSYENLKEWWNRKAPVSCYGTWKMKFL